MCKLAKRQQVNDSLDFNQQMDEYYDSCINDVAPEPEPEYEVWFVVCKEWATDRIEYVADVCNSYEEADSQVYWRTRSMPEATRDDFYFDVEGMTKAALNAANFIGY